MKYPNLHTCYATNARRQTVVFHEWGLMYPVIRDVETHLRGEDCDICETFARTPVRLPYVWPCGGYLDGRSRRAHVEVQRGRWFSDRWWTRQ